VVKKTKKGSKFNIWRHPWHLFTAPRSGTTCLTDMYYKVRDKFVYHQAAGIYYIPWPTKNNCCPKFSHTFVCQKSQNSSRRNVKAAKKLLNFLHRVFLVKSIITWWACKFTFPIDNNVTHVFVETSQLSFCFTFTIATLLKHSDL